MSRRIFMLEDDPAQAGIVRILAEEAGWEFETVGRVADALASARAFRPDLMLLDVGLPDGNGFDALRELRKEPALAAVPVMFLTSQGDPASRLMGFAAGGQDYVTKPFHLKELLARIQAHLAVKDQRDSLAGQLEELTLRERVRQDVADMVVHDLRDQLSSIHITLELVRRSGLIADERYLSFLESAEATSDFMVLLVNDLLDLGADKVRIHPAPLDADAVVSRVVGLFTPKVERRRVAFRATAAPLPGPFVTDPTLLFRIVANLVSNALKFSRPGQSVTVALRPAGAGLRAEIDDEGPGVPAAEKDKIFLKYHRAETPESRAAEGSGIGLAFCRLAVESLGGRIWVEDRSPSGSRFAVELPPLTAA